MLNYIWADYRRILLRIPRLLIVAIYQIILSIVVIVEWRKTGASFSSVDFLRALDIWLDVGAILILGGCALVNVFGDDFSCKTVQVAIGIGISRFKVVVAKLIQTIMILFSDVLITGFVLMVLTFITGAHMVPQQVLTLALELISVVIRCTCWISLISFLIFKFQKPLVPMVVFLLMQMRLIEGLLQLITYSGPELLEKLRLDKLGPDFIIAQAHGSLVLLRFDMVAFLGIVFYTALGVAVAYLVFRKQELDF